MFLWISLLLTPSVSTGCLEPELFRRSGSESCWVQLTPEPSKKLCVSHSIFNQWLQSPRLCVAQNPQSRWRAFAILKNSDELPDKSPILVQHLLLKPTSTKQTVWKKIERLRERISQILAPLDPWGVLRALILNEGTGKNGLQFLRTLGFVHILSASGIHLYAVGRSWDDLMRVLSQKWGIRVKTGRRISAATTGILCCYLWILSGARVGMLRPAAVILLKQLAINLGFRWSKGSPLFLALLLESFHGSRGKWVYALSVGGGLFLYDYFKSFSLGHLGLAIGSWIGIALWEIWEKNQVALATPLLSLVTLPLLCSWAYPALVAMLTLRVCSDSSLLDPAIQVLTWGMNKTLEILTHGALWPGNLWVVPRTALVVSFLISFGMASFFLVLQLKPKWEWRLAIIFLFAACSGRWAVGRSHPPPSFVATQVEQLDVGQGDSALVIAPSSAGLIDVGSEHALSSHGWLDVLARRQVSQLNWISLSHLDEDHVGSLAALGALVRVNCVSASAPELDSPRGRKLIAKLNHFGISVRDWNAPCMPFPILPPSNAPTRKTKKKAGRNEFMASFWIPLQSGGSYLNAGDSNSEQEIRVARWVAELEAQNPLKPSSPRILKISHHGSRFSSSMEFIEKVHPTEAWISAGIGNTYGHPASSVLELLHKKQIPTRRTDEQGFISSKEGGDRHPPQIHRR